jgi:hypothetical protein
MPFVKGQVPPNPGGLTPRKVAMMRRLEGLTIKAVDALEYALDNGTTSERITAAREVFDRTVGKPKQSGTLEVTHNASPHLAALVGMAAQTMQRVQTVPENSPQVIDVTDYHPKPIGSDLASLESDEAERGN